MDLGAIVLSGRGMWFCALGRGGKFAAGQVWAAEGLGQYQLP